MTSGHTNYLKFHSTYKIMTYKIMTYKIITPHVYFYFVFFVCVFGVREGRSVAISPLMHRMSLSPLPLIPGILPGHLGWFCEIWFSGPLIPRALVYLCFFVLCPSTWLVKLYLQCNQPQGAIFVNNKWGRSSDSDSDHTTEIIIFSYFFIFWHHLIAFIIEARYFDRIDMTEKRLEYDRKKITPTNMTD